MTALTTADALALAARALRDGPPAVGATVVESDGALPLGARMLVWADRHRGTLGGAEADAAVLSAARGLLDAGAPRTLPVAGGAVYLEPHRPPAALIIVGAGHIARPLCTLGAMLGFRVTVLDDRPEFATRERFPEADRVVRADFSDPFSGIPIGPHSHLVLVTRGHKYDFEALRDLIARPRPPAYIGMVGSRRRVRAALEQLARDGIAPDRLRGIHAPIGLDIGAETPAEIAISIAAELVRLRRGGSGTPLRDREGVVDRWIDRPPRSG